MALITCPNCGKSVSDSAKTCIHCGFKFEEKIMNFYALPHEKKAELKSAYIMQNGKIPQDYGAEHAAYMRKFKIYLILIILSAMPLFGSFLAAFFEGIILLTIGILPLVAMGIFTILLIKTNKKHENVMQQMIKERVDFEQWLNDNHNLKITWDWGSSAKYFAEYRQLKQKRGMKE